MRFEKKNKNLAFKSIINTKNKNLSEKTFLYYKKKYRFVPVLFSLSCYVKLL